MRRSLGIVVVVLTLLSVALPALAWDDDHHRPSAPHQEQSQSQTAIGIGSASSTSTSGASAVAVGSNDNLNINYNNPTAIGIVGPSSAGASASATAPTNVEVETNVPRALPTPGPLPATPTTDVAPMAPKHTSAPVFMPTEMTVREAGVCAEKLLPGDNNTSVRVIYATAGDPTGLSAKVKVANLAGRATAKGDDHLGPLCEVVYELGSKGADTIFITLMEPAYDAKTKAFGIGLGGNGGAAGGNIAGGGGLLGLSIGISTNFFKERWTVNGLGFRTYQAPPKAQPKVSAAPATIQFAAAGSDR